MALPYTGPMPSNPFSSGAPQLPDWLQTAQPLNAMPQTMPTLNLPTKFRKGGMFGSGYSFGQALSDGLNGYLAGMGNPVGQANIQALHQQRMLQQRQALDEQQYAQRRKDQLSDAMQLIDYRAQNKPDDVFTAQMRAAGIDPASPAGQKLYRQRVETMASPPYFFTDPTTGQVMSVPRSQPQAQPLTDEDIDRLSGGTSGNAGGGFPGPY